MVSTGNKLGCFYVRRFISFKMSINLNINLIYLKLKIYQMYLLITHNLWEGDRVRLHNLILVVTWVGIFETIMVTLI